MHSFEPITSAQARKLNSFLQAADQPQGTLNLNALKGYLFCICTLPQLIPPSEWLPGVFGGDAPALGAESDMDNLQIIMQLYNQINNEILEERPKLPANCTLSPQTADNFKPGHALHDWAVGFDLGLQAFSDTWLDLCEDNAEMAASLYEFWGGMTFFCAEEKYEMLKEVSKDEPVEVIARAIRRDLPYMIKEYAFLSREIYQTLLSDSHDPAPDSGPDGWPENTFSDELQDLLEAAYEAESVEESVEFARRALELDPESLDAQLLIAQAERDIHRRISALEQVVSIGEKQLGKKFFKENTGHFWGLIETRPYMRALSALAETCRQAGQAEKSLAYYERCLELNPNDNQGIRTLVIAIYLERQMLDKADALLKAYEEDGSAFMLYSKLLLAYIREGDSPNARALKKQAITYNKHVPKLLAGRTKMPKHLPDYYGIGDKNEAVLFVDTHQDAWRRVIGAIGWLLK